MPKQLVLKVQTCLAPPGGPYLIYDRRRRIQELKPRGVLPKLDDAMQGVVLRYFYANVDGLEIEFLFDKPVGDREMNW